MQHRPLRICIFSRGMRRHGSFSPSPPGMIGSVLAGLGHSVTVLTGALPDGSGAICSEADCTVHYIAGAPALKSGEAFWRLSAETCDRLHETEGPFDVVMGRGTMVWGFLRQSRFADEVPVILHEGTYPRWLHQLETRARGWLAWMAYPMAPVFAMTNPKMHHCLRRASRVVCIAPALATAFRRIAWWNPPKTIALTYGFDVSRYHPQTPDPTEPPRLVALGRMTWDKGVLRMIDVLARLQSQTARLVSFGPASPKVLQAVLDHAARRGVTARYSAPGVVQYEDVPDRLAGAVAFLFPSTHAEGLGKVVQEAMAAGLPVVAFRLPVLDGLIDDGVTGFQVPIRSIRAMADRVDQLIADPDLRARMGAAARRKIETDFAPEAINAQWQALLAEVVAEARAKRGG